MKAYRCMYAEQAGCLCASCQKQLEFCCLSHLDLTCPMDAIIKPEQNCPDYEPMERKPKE